MKMRQNLRLMLLLPLVVAMLVSLGAVYLNQTGADARFQQAQASQQADMQALLDQAGLTQALIQAHGQLLTFLAQPASQALARQQQHEGLTDALDALWPALQRIANNAVQASSLPGQLTPQEQAFTSYRNFAVMATDAMVSHPQESARWLAQAHPPYLALTAAMADSAQTATASVFQRLTVRAREFTRTNEQLLLISSSVLLLALFLVHVFIRRASSSIVDIADGLSLLTASPDVDVALPRVEHLRNHGSGELQRVANSLLEFHKVNTQRQQAEDKALELAFYDPLTDLPNRRLLNERIRQAHARSAENDTTASALLLLDLDNFKSFNDLQGHSAGDMALKEVGQRLQTTIPPQCIVARVGGNAFAVLLRNLVQAEGSALELAEKMIFSLGKPLLIERKKFFFTASVGISIFDARLQDMDEPLKNAEAAMYVAKGLGRNKIQFFDPSVQARLQAQLQLEEDLRHALPRRQLQLFYQPQVDAQGRHVGVEALVRWIHPKRGMVSPSEFIVLAEASDLILPMGLWVLQTACEQLQKWATHPQRAHLTIAINVSARQFAQPDFVNQIQQELQRTGIPPQLLKIELTESAVLDDIETTISRMHALRQLGLKLSMDDFGTGYSSLQYLKRLPLDQLKIDQAFIREITSNKADAAIVETIVAMGVALGMTVIAEGVETTEQQRLLLEKGCKFYQGYLFGRPVPVSALEVLLQQQAPVESGLDGFASA